MTTRYSATTKGFYSYEFSYAALPGDLVDIDDAYHAQLIAGQAAGQVIVAGTDGVPVLADPPPEPVQSPRLDRQQWGFFLDVTGFRAAATAALAAMPKSSAAEIAGWAGMKAVIEASEFYRLDVATDLVARVRAMNLPGVTLPDDAAITAAWATAAAFQGVASLP